MFPTQIPLAGKNAYDHYDGTQHGEKYKGKAEWKKRTVLIDYG